MIKTILLKTDPKMVTTSKCIFLILSCKDKLLPKYTYQCKQKFNA